MKNYTNVVKSFSNSNGRVVSKFFDRIKDIFLAPWSFRYFINFLQDFSIFSKSNLSASEYFLMIFKLYRFFDTFHFYLTFPCFWVICDFFILIDVRCFFIACFYWLFRYQSLYMIAMEINKKFRYYSSLLEYYVF